MDELLYLHWWWKSWCLLYCIVICDRAIKHQWCLLLKPAVNMSCQVPYRAEEITIPADVTPERVPTHIVDYSGNLKQHCFCVWLTNHSHLVNCISESSSGFSALTLTCSFIFHVLLCLPATEAEQTDEQLFQEISKVSYCIMYSDVLRGKCRVQ